MSIAERLTTLVTEHSALVVVVMLVVSVGMGAGMAFLDDEAGLNQFQFESEESEALDYIGENFESGDEETTTVQVVVRSDGNALTRDSLLATLELQQDIREDDEIAGTLADEDAFGDLASVVATAAIRQDRAAELTERREQLNATAAELEARGEDLNTTAAELEARGEELNATAADLEARGEELNATAAELETALDETATLAAEYAQLNRSLEAGQVSRSEYDQRTAEIDSELDRVLAEATADLDEEQAATFARATSNLREIQSGLVELDAAREAGRISEAEYEQRRADLQAQREDVYRQGTRGVLADEFTQLEEESEQLEAEFTQLEEESEQLEAEFARLEEEGEQLETAADELEADRAELEADFEQLAAEFEQLRERDPSLEAQQEQLESMDDDDVAAVVEQVLGPDAPREALAFVPTEFERGTTETDARQLFVVQSPEEEVAGGDAPPTIVESQLAIADHVDERFGDDAFVFGAGIISDEIDRSMGDSMAIVLPLALVFVVIVLSIAYRDPLDILLGVLGIVLVLVWTFGFMGWTGISFNQIMIAVPVLLVGLSIDYAIHVFMRHREQRMDGTAETRRAMAAVLASLGAALVWVTATAVIGFLSNLVSPVAPIREFGIVSAFGITATLVIFGTFVPAAKVGLDAVLEARGWDRRKRAFGTGGGAFTRVLSGGYTLSRRMPAAVLLVTLLITAGGAYGAIQVDTTFSQEDFIADEPADWMESLPGGLAPGDYAVKQNLEFVNERFLRQDTNTQVLLRDDVTSDDTLEDLATARETANERDIVVSLSGDPDIRSPLSVMKRTAAGNETFNETFHAADTDGDGVPDDNLTAVYDAFFETAPDQASDVIYREDGEYAAVRMVLSIQGDASAAEATDGTRDVAGALDRGDRPAIATGQLVVFNVVEDELFNTVIESLVVTMVVVFVFLMIAYRFVHGSAVLGAVTLTPILLTVAWILGTMYLLDISFNVITGTITSLTIGLGVAYNIHMSERYRLELDRGRDVWDSMHRAVTGTGGALLGSAATTAGGFGVLALAILPPLQQFGIITGITIVYAFLGSVFVLPSFLVLWTRYVGPADQFPAEESEADEDQPAVPADESETDDEQPAVPAESTEDGHRPKRGPDHTPPSSMTEFDPGRSTETASQRPAGSGSRTTPFGPTRRVEPSLLEPGWSYTVTLSIPLAAGRTMLAEHAPTATTTVRAVDPEPVDSVTSSGSLYVRWDVETPTVATVTYTADAPPRETGTFSIEGVAVTDRGEQSVDGQTAVTVVGDVLARFDGAVTEKAVRAAGQKLEHGDISETEYQQIASAWLARGGSEGQTGDAGRRSTRDRGGDGRPVEGKRDGHAGDGAGSERGSQ